MLNGTGGELLEKPCRGCMTMGKICQVCCLAKTTNPSEIGPKKWISMAKVRSYDAISLYISTNTIQTGVAICENLFTLCYDYCRTNLRNVR